MEYKIQDTTLNSIADAINEKIGESDLMTPAEMVEKIQSIPAGDFIPNSEKGAAGGVAELDSTGKVPSEQLPAMNYIPTSQKGAASGVATLGTDSKVPVAQLPYQYSETDLKEGVSPLATGTLYFVYE